MALLQRSAVLTVSVETVADGCGSGDFATVGVWVAWVAVVVWAIAVDVAIGVALDVAVGAVA